MSRLLLCSELIEKLDIILICSTSQLHVKSIHSWLAQLKQLKEGNIWYVRETSHFDSQLINYWRLVNVPQPHEKLIMFYKKR